jgi:hypothetical protein
LVLLHVCQDWITVFAASHWQDMSSQIEKMLLGIHRGEFQSRQDQIASGVVLRAPR